MIGLIKKKKKDSESLVFTNLYYMVVHNGHYDLMVARS